MIMRVKVFLAIPGKLADIVRASMLEDDEIFGSVRYAGNDLVKAEIEVRCNTPAGCLATIEDRLRCLTLLEDLYSIFREK